MFYKDIWLLTVLLQNLDLVLDFFADVLCLYMKSRLMITILDMEICEKQANDDN